MEHWPYILLAFMAQIKATLLLIGTKWAEKGATTLLSDWRLLKTPLFTAAGVPSKEPVRLSGEVVCEEPLVSPIGSRACVYYRLDIFWHQHPLFFGRHETLACVDDAVTFNLRDTTGEVEVRGLTASFELVDAHTSQTNPSQLERFPKAVEFLASRDIRLAPEQDLWIVETTLPIGSQVMVSGIVFGQANQQNKKCPVLESAWMNNKPLVVSNRQTLSMTQRLWLWFERLRMLSAHPSTKLH